MYIYTFSHWSLGLLFGMEKRVWITLGSKEGWNLTLNQPNLMDYSLLVLLFCGKTLEDKNVLLSTRNSVAVYCSLTGFIIFIFLWLHYFAALALAFTEVILCTSFRGNTWLFHLILQVIKTRMKTYNGGRSQPQIWRFLTLLLTSGGWPLPFHTDGAKPHGDWSEVEEVFRCLMYDAS